MAEPRERTPKEREAARAERERRRTQELDGDQLLYEPEEAEEPIGIRRVSPGPLVQPRALDRGGASAAPPARAARARHSRMGRAVSLLALVLAAAVIWFGVELFQPLHGAGHGSVSVTIPAHSSSSQIGDQLERDGVIGSSFFFELRATLGGQRGDLRSGAYRLKIDMPYADVLRILSTPPPPVKVTNLTIVEGRTRRQIDALLRSQGVAGSYLAATRHSPLLNPRRFGAPRTTPSLEGFLFPSTYQLRAPITIAELVADQLRTFRQRFASVKLGYPNSRHLSAYDVLIIASMVEAEAQTVHDRPLVASVIYNRLRLGMPLQIDATVRYAVGNYTHPITQSQLGVASPWNTYVHKGLPPTPIDNPGMSSIDATAQPARTNYLYFVVKPCGNGEHVFASSYSQFLTDQQRYYSARTAHGGRSPAHC